MAWAHSFYRIDRRFILCHSDTRTAFVVRPPGHGKDAPPGYPSNMSRMPRPEGEQIMFPTIEIPCRVDYRPVGAQQHFCEWTGRVTHLSATGCSIGTTHQPEPGSRLELRIYLPGRAWPMQVKQAEIVWSHWGEFTVEFLEVSMGDLDQLQGCLRNTSLLAAA